MMQTHLSDEAIAAFADGVLRGSARERAGRHLSECAECAYAVAVQREAVWALRAAPAPPLPTALIDRLRSVPVTTPIENIPSALGPDGSAMFGTFGAAAFVAPAPRRRQAPAGHNDASAHPHAVGDAVGDAGSHGSHHRGVRRFRFGR